MALNVAEGGLDRAQRHAMRPVEGIHLRLLGGFGLCADRLKMTVPQSGQRLLGFLALAGEPQERSLVAANLWPDKPEERAAANLRSAVWRLPDVAGDSLVECSRSSISLNQRVTVDVMELERAVQSMTDFGATGGDLLDSTSLARELLPGWYDDWVIVERERLLQLQLHFMEAATYELLRRNRPVAALDMALRLVAADSLREGSQRALLTVYCAQGSLRQAQRQLDRYDAELRSTFGCGAGFAIADIRAEVGNGRRPGG